MTVPRRSPHRTNPSFRRAQWHVLIVADRRGVGEDMTRLIDDRPIKVVAFTLRSGVGSLMPMHDEAGATGDGSSAVGPCCVTSRVGGAAIHQL